MVSLQNLVRNLTEEAREGKLDPVIGRNKEIQETAEILVSSYQEQSCPCRGCWCW